MSTSKPGSLRSMPFTAAEIVPSSPGGATVRYSYGYNCSGVGCNEVIQQVRYPDGKEHSYVIMRGSGLSNARAQAIAMILNAPEEG